MCQVWHVVSLPETLMGDAERGMSCSALPPHPGKALLAHAQCQDVTVVKPTALTEIRIVDGTTLAYLVGEQRPCMVLTSEGEWIALREDEKDAPNFHHGVWRIFPGNTSEMEFRAHLSAKGFDPDTGIPYAGPHWDYTNEDYEAEMGRLEAADQAADQVPGALNGGPMNDLPEVEYGDDSSEVEYCDNSSEVEYHDALDREEAEEQAAR